MLKNFFLIIIILSSSSCRIFIEPMPKTWNWGFKPRPLTGVRGFPEADTLYGKGFKDGCEMAFDAVAKGLMTEVNDAKYDYKLMKQGGDYDDGWWDGMEQCVNITDWNVL
jgi:hypothetical protein